MDGYRMLAEDPEWVELDVIHEINAHLPFADPILPGRSWKPGGKYYTLQYTHWLAAGKRRRLLDRMTRSTRYVDEF